MPQVLDTNIVVAGFLWDGPPRRLIELAIAGEAVGLFSSPMLLDRLAHTLSYSRFERRIEAFGTSTSGAGGAVHGAGQPCGAAQRAPIVTNDVGDDHVIAAAVAARAELVVIWDRKHLLPIGSHQGVAIVTAREVLERTEARGKT